MEINNTDGLKTPPFMGNGNQTSRRQQANETVDRNKYDNAKAKSLNGTKRVSKKSKKKTKSSKLKNAMIEFFVIAMLVVQLLNFSLEQFNEFTDENDKISTMTSQFIDIVKNNKELHYKMEGNMRVPVFNEDNTQEYGYDVSGIINETLEAINNGGNEIVAITTIGNVMGDVGASDFNSVVRGVTGAENYSEWLANNGFKDDKEAEKAKDDIALGMAVNNEARSTSELDNMLNETSIKNTTGAITDGNVK